MTIFDSVSGETVAAGAAALGAITVKILEKWLSTRGEQKRTELLHTSHVQELDVLRLEIEKINRVSAKWQKKYWESRVMLESDEHKIEELNKMIEELQSRVEKQEAHNHDE